MALLFLLAASFLHDDGPLDCDRPEAFYSLPRPRRRRR
jgi:hypothetical protein